MNDKHGFLAVVFGVAMLLATGCDEGDEGPNDGAGDSETGDSETGDSETGDGDGDIDPPGDGDPDTGDDTGGDVGGDEGGEPQGCASYETVGDCVAQAECSPIFGKPLIDEGDGSWCTKASEEFIGCASASDLCPGIGKTLCDGVEYWRTSACVPDNLEVCDAPGDITGSCDDDGWA
ncbi:MAG: hypothetical protein R6X02_09105 [Enhygromyxa sp.]